MAYFFLILTTCCIGSLLCLISDRYPLMLYRQWQYEPDNTELRTRLTQLPDRFNLMMPRSHCASCQTPLRWFHTIPILSFFCLKARCAFCNTPLSHKMWITEFCSALLCLSAVMLFGWSIEALAFMFLYLSLLTLTIIDLEHRLLPDTMTLSLLWLGLAGQLVPNLFPLSATNAITGAIVGYLTPWLIAFVFEKVRRKPGLGLGDAKLLAAIGAWGGPLIALTSLFFAAISCLLVSLPLLACKRLSRETLIPFGPFIAWVGALLITLSSLGIDISSWLIS